MKLAELLAERISCEKKLANLSDRIKNNISYTEDVPAIESASELISTYNEVLDRQRNIIRKIIKANMIKNKDGDCISDLLIERDFISKEIGLYTKLMKHIDQQRNPDTSFRFRADTSPTKYKYDINPITLQKQLDNLHSAFSAIDAKIQACNWSTEVD